MNAISPISSASDQISSAPHAVLPGFGHLKAVDYLTKNPVSFEIISTAGQARGEMLAALPHTPTIVELVDDMGDEVEQHPAAARANQLFTLTMRILAPNEAEPIVFGDGITRVVALSPGELPGMRGNMSAEDSQILQDWMTSGQQPRLLFTAYPSHIEELIDMEQENQLLSQKQLDDLAAAQKRLEQRMRHEAQAASMQSMSAQVGLITAIGVRISAQIGAFNKISADKTATKDGLLVASQAIRQDSRAMASQLKSQAGNPVMSAGMRMAMAAGLKELRAIGVMAEKQAPKIAAPAATRIHAATQTKAPVAEYRAANAPIQQKPSTLNRGTTVIPKGQLYKALAKAGISKPAVTMTQTTVAAPVTAAPVNAAPLAAAPVAIAPVIAVVANSAPQTTISAPVVAVSMVQAPAQQQPQQTQMQTEQTSVAAATQSAMQPVAQEQAVQPAIAQATPAETKPAVIGTPPKQPETKQVEARQVEVKEAPIKEREAPRKEREIWVRPEENAPPKSDPIMFKSVEPIIFKNVEAPKSIAPIIVSLPDTAEKKVIGGPNIKKEFKEAGKAGCANCTGGCPGCPVMSLGKTELGKFMPKPK